MEAPSVTTIVDVMYMSFRDTFDYRGKKLMYKTQTQWKCWKCRKSQFSQNTRTLYSIIYIYLLFYFIYFIAIITIQEYIKSRIDRYYIFCFTTCFYVIRYIRFVSRPRTEIIIGDNSLYIYAHLPLYTKSILWIRMWISWTYGRDIITLKAARFILILCDWKWCELISLQQPLWPVK